jgi:peptide/nickel transport system substrate-binding protein
VVAIDAAPQSVDPRFGVDAASSRVADLVHRGLTRDDGAGRRLPALATSWEQPDPTTLVFHLRRDLRFPDGAPVTARDVAATYAAVMDPALASPKRAALAPIAAVEAPADDTVVVHLRKPFPPVLDATGIGIVPGARAPLPAEVTDGAGPYRVARRVPGEGLVLELNPGWPGPRPSIRRIELRVVPDPLVRVLELVRGGVQLTQDLPEPALRDWLGQRPGLHVDERPGTSFDYLALNCGDPRLGQRRVRQAIALALDRAALLALVQGDAGRLATGLLAPEHWAYAPARLPRHDPARARRLLDRAGLRDPDGTGPAARFTLIYKTTAVGPRRRLAEAVQAQLAEVGIAVDVRTYEWGTLFADVRSGRFEVAALAWVGVGDPDLYFLSLHSTMVPPDGYNRGRFASPVIDRLTAAARRTADVEARRALYARIQRRAAHELPVVPLWWEDRVAVASARLAGFVPTASGELTSLADAHLD